MTPEDIVELNKRKYMLLLGVEAAQILVTLGCYRTTRESLSQTDFHLRQIELIELREKMESKSSRDAATPREP